MKIKAGDNVVVIAGKDKNKTGKVLRVLPKAGRLVVEGLNKATKHVRKTKERAGQKIEFEAPMDASNVMIIDPKTKKRARIGYTFEKDGTKKRVTKQAKTTL